MKPAMYANYYCILRELAIEHGYSLAIHGSLLNDLDLIAVPWVENPKLHKELVKAIGDKIGELTYTDELIESWKEIKPHGRISYSLPSGGGTYIDLSIIVPHNEQS